MIDPVIFTIGGFSLRWYGVIVMLGVVVGSLMVERALKRNGENSDTIWDALIWVLPIGILGARLWFVINATLGGDTRYANDPSEILKVCHSGGLGWDPADALAPMGDRARIAATVEDTMTAVMAAVRPGDHVLCMSNGGFGGIHARLLDALRSNPPTHSIAIK